MYIDLFVIGLLISLIGIIFAVVCYLIYMTPIVFKTDKFFITENDEIIEIYDSFDEAKKRYDFLLEVNGEYANYELISAK